MFLNMRKKIKKLMTKMTHQEFKRKKTPYPQDFLEKFVVGRTLPYGRGDGYCFLACILYGIAELSSISIRDMIEKIKDSGDLRFFNKKNGFVSSIYELSYFVTDGKYPINLDCRVESRIEAKQVARKLGRPYFYIAKFPMHYVYFDKFGWYINPYENSVVDKGNIIGWRVLSAR